MNCALNTLIPPRYLFHFAVPVRHVEPVWPLPAAGLGEAYRLLNLAALDAGTEYNEPHLADVRMAWSTHGIAVQVDLGGKTQPPWCRESRLEDSDGLQVWIDTRATHNIHRASKFCHRFVFLPVGGGRKGQEPLADQLLINRARENARPVRPRELQVTSHVRPDGYRLAAYIPAEALGGYDPQQHPRLGFNYAVLDRERGLQTFASGPGFPYDEDPACWATLDLVEH